MSPAPPARVLVSAHAAADHDPGPENSRAALGRALATGADYVELDVRRCRDGTFVLSHESSVPLDGKACRVADLTHVEFAAAAPDALRLEEALEVVAGRAGVHLDLKLRSPAAAYSSPASTHEVAAAGLAASSVGAQNLVVTTGNVDAVRAVREWSDTRGEPLRLGLTIGGSVAGRPLPQQVGARLAELFPAARVAESRADVVVANKWLALANVARTARCAGLPLLVWTVDEPVLLRHWLRPGRAWMVTTNRPALAVALRAASESPA